MNEDAFAFDLQRRSLVLGGLGVAATSFLPGEALAKILALHDAQDGRPG